MKFHFSIEYRTNWGEEVKLCGSTSELGNNQQRKAISLNTVNGTNWNLEIDIKLAPSEILSYHYLVVKNDLIIREEWNAIQRSIFIPKNKSTYYVEDSWRNIPQDRCFYSTAFTDIWFMRKDKKIPINSYRQSVLIKAYAPNIQPNGVLAISGNQDIMGHWDPNKAIVMSDATYPEWQQAIDATLLTHPIEYKFVILDKKTKNLIAWELSPNRYLNPPTIEKDQHLIISDRFAYFDSKKWRGTGVTIPVFALRSKRSWGIGEFLDLKKLIDWAVITRQNLIQILPINDTTHTFSWLDSYPYRCISVFALNPIYLNLDELGIADTEYASAYQKDRKEINQLKQIDFPFVQIKKHTYIHAIYKLKGRQTLDSKDFHTFFQQNHKWLKPYAVYLYLRKKFTTSDTSKWNQYKEYKEEFITEFSQPQHEAFESLQYSYFVQYHLYAQLKEVHNYAKTKGIVLKGDLPIGISLQSVDSWTNPNLFHLNSQAGAPPDDFATQGQNWGFPTYNWEEMAKDNFSWWKNRLQYMSSFFDAYRIDHILGFFRIWSIPRNALYGILGQFYPALPLSVEEIEKQGIQFRKDLFTKPYIHKTLLNKLFTSERKEVINFFFTATNHGLYDFKEEFNTQRKIHLFFKSKESKLFNKKTETILLNLHSNVLFLKDEINPNTYHPRIQAQKVAAFQLLKPEEKTAFNSLYEDFFYQRHNLFWQKEAYKKLPKLIEATNMLVCGEDLGMIPNSVPWVMQDLSILSLEIQRMPKKSGFQIGDPNSYPYHSVSSFSTHDMSTIRGWWSKSPNLRENYWTNSLKINSKEIPSQITPTLAKAIIQKELNSNSMLSIQAIQDWISLTDKWYEILTPEEEQINIPANSKHEWKFRMPCYIEDLIENEELNSSITESIEHSNRNTK